MDRGVAAEDRIAGLARKGYRYIVVGRERRRRFDPGAALAIQTASRQTIRLRKTISDDGREARLYRYSAERAEKERAIVERFATRFRNRARPTPPRPVPAPDAQTHR